MRLPWGFIWCILSPCFPERFGPPLPCCLRSWFSPTPSCSLLPHQHEPVSAQSAESNYNLTSSWSKITKLSLSVSWSEKWDWKCPLCGERDFHSGKLVKQKVIKLGNVSLLLPSQPTVLSFWCTVSKHYLNSWETNLQIFRSALRSLLCYSHGAAYSRSPGSHISLCLFSPKFQAACSQRYEIGSGTSMTLGTSVLGSTYGQFILIFLTPGILTCKLCLHSMAPVRRCYLMEGLQSLPHL